MPAACAKKPTWNLVPGEPWQEALEEALDGSRSCAVFLGPAGLGTWENEEMRTALDIRAGRPDFHVVIASSRPDEVSWAPSGMENSLFTHYLLEALRGQARTLGDGYVRVFDVFRHIADRVPDVANQHPIFKATEMEEDFPVAPAGEYKGDA